VTVHWLDHLALVSLGLVVAAIAAVPARKLLRRDPSSCYRLSLALLLGALALLPIQWIVQGVAHELARPLRERLPPWLDRAEPVDPSDETILVERAPAREPRRVAGPAAEPDLLPIAAAALAAGAEGVGEAGFSDRLATWRARIAAAFRIAAEKLRGAVGLAIWLAGAALLIGRRAIGLWRTRRLVRRARPVDDPRLLELWRSIAAGSRVGARTRLLISRDVRSPACVGWLRPALLLPEDASLGPDVLAWALRHELVHLERGDWLVAALQSLVTSALWFHPAAWWLSAEIGRLRELSCDQVVVEGFGRRKSYALALLEYAAARAHPTHPRSAIDAGPHSAGVRCALLHWSRSPSQIQRRIEMLTVESGTGSGTRRMLGRALALAAFVVPALGQVGVAATLFPKDGEKTAQSAPAPAVLPPAVVAAKAAQDEAIAADDAKKAAMKKRLVLEKKIAADARDEAMVTLKQQLGVERAAAEKVRADGRDRVAKLKSKLAAAREADDEEACEALEAALDRCVADCDAACDEWDLRCDELEEQLETFDFAADDFDSDFEDLAVDAGDFDFNFEFDDDADFDVFFGEDDADLAIDELDADLRDLAYLNDDGDEHAARKVEMKRAMAEAEKRLAEAAARMEKMRQDGVLGLEQQQEELARAKEALGRDMEKVQHGLKQAAKVRALSEADRAKLEDEIAVARKSAQAQARKSSKAAGEARKIKEGALRAAGRKPLPAHAPDAEKCPECVEPLAPAPPAPPALPEGPRMRGRTPNPKFAPVPPTPTTPSPAERRAGGREEMLQQRIEALERELQELRAALAEQQRAREPKARTPRVRSMQ
jgi:beta-lactamase regulating signal transducer with metallopeptidase domain